MLTSQGRSNVDIVPRLLLSGSLVVGIYLILYYLGACRNSEAVEEGRDEAATQPIVPVKEIPCTYRTSEEDPTSSLNCLSGDLYDNKICAICYDEMRDCFLTPCGHSISCYMCAQRYTSSKTFWSQLLFYILSSFFFFFFRIVEESNVCPICRRLIHKVRRFMSSWG